MTVENPSSTTQTAVPNSDTSRPQERKISVHIYVLPNLITTANIFFGFFAIIQSVKGHFKSAAYAIVLAAIFDMLDGRLARLTRSTSKFGAEYDSLCDLVSFGVAPAVLLYLWALQPFGRLGWVACFFFMTAGALRLARFNVQAHLIEKGFFQGLPIPMAAGIVASSVLAYYDMGWIAEGDVGLLLMTFVVALVMVSNFRYRSFKDIDLRERLPFHNLVLGVLLLAWVAYQPELNLFILFIVYTVLGAIFGIFRIGRDVQKLRHERLHPHDSDIVFDDDHLDKENHHP